MITDHERFLSEVRRTSGQGLQGVRSEYKSLEVWFLKFSFDFIDMIYFLKEF